MNSLPYTHEYSPRCKPCQLCGCERNGAFTLLEVMLAIGILGIGLISVASVFPVALIQQKRAADDTTGVIFGNNVLSALKGAGILVFDLPKRTFFKPMIDDFDRPELVFNLLKDLTYDYDLAYRRVNKDGPVEVAVFVYRRDRDTTAENLVRIGMNFPFRIKADGQMLDEPEALHRRSQLLLTENRDSARPRIGGAVFVVRVMKQGMLVAGPDSSRAPTDSVLYLFNDQNNDGILEENEDVVRASAIVMGFMK